jgi:hypothetical protein
MKLGIFALMFCSFINSIYSQIHQGSEGSINVDQSLNRSHSKQNGVDVFNLEEEFSTSLKEMSGGIGLGGYDQNQSFPAVLVSIFSSTSRSYDNYLYVKVQNERTYPIKLEFTYTRDQKSKASRQEDEYDKKRNFSGSIIIPPKTAQWEADWRSQVDGSYIRSNMAKVAIAALFENASKDNQPFRDIKQIVIRVKDARLVDEVPVENKQVSPSSDTENPGNDKVKIDRYGMVEETIQDPVLRAQVEEESRAALKTWVRDEYRKDEDFESIRKEAIQNWRNKLRINQASFDDHPDVQAIHSLTGQEGVLIAPSIAKEFDNALVDRGWYPYVKEGDVKDIRYQRSKRNPLIYKFQHPDVEKGIEVPSYNSIREHYLSTFKEKK